MHNLRCDTEKWLTAAGTNYAVDVHVADRHCKHSTKKKSRRGIARSPIVSVICNGEQIDNDGREDATSMVIEELI